MIGAAIADHHFDETSRFEECICLHREFSEQVAEAGARFVVSAGDVYERASTPIERRAVAEWLQDLGRRVRGPIVIVRGNHDRTLDLDILRRLWMPVGSQVIVVEGLGIQRLSIGLWSPSVESDDEESAALDVGCLAWPRKATLLAALEKPVTPAESSEVAQDLLRQSLTGMRGLWRDGVPRLLVSHAMVSGAVVSTGQPLVGQDMELSISDLALAGAELTILGHIHKSQEWTFGEDGHDRSYLYTGSPRRTAYGELENKGWVLLKHDGAAWSWERRWLSAPPMLLWEATWRDGDFWFEVPRTLGYRGADIRFRYAVAAEERDAARLAATKLRDYTLSNGAARFTIDPVVTATSTARVPDVARATTLEEKLRAMWKARGESVEERLLAKVAVLEEES